MAAVVLDDGEEDRLVDGDLIRFFWDYGVVIPLWDADGPLPEEPDWLQQNLGLSGSLIADLARWGNDMNELDGYPHLRTPEAYEALDVRGRRLVQRLRDEVQDRFDVEYRPW